MRFCAESCRFYPFPPLPAVFSVIYQRSGKLPKKSGAETAKEGIPKPSLAPMWGHGHMEMRSRRRPVHLNLHFQEKGTGKRRTVAASSNPCFAAPSRAQVLQNRYRNDLKILNNFHYLP